MKIKICGIKYPDNVYKIASLDVDMLGFIFYEKSPRHAENCLNKTSLNLISSRIKKVGVFVNEDLDVVLEKIQKYNLDLVQLHGNESPEYCGNLHKRKIKIIKAFNISNDFNFKRLYDYQNFVDYFLFDASGKLKGGNGKCFNWNLLNNYSMSTAFFLSGGIGENNITQALKIHHPAFYGIDINSKIEIVPGLKSYAKTKKIINLIRNHTKK